MSYETYLTCRREKANAKTYNFWSFKKFTGRLACTAEEYGISVEVRSEAWTSQECPQCGSTDRTTQHRDTLTCPCGFEGHADLTASETFPKRHQNSESSDWRTRREASRQRQTEQAVRPMARPVRFQWDDHDWLESSRSHERLNERRTDPSTVHRGGKCCFRGRSEIGDFRDDENLRFSDQIGITETPTEETAPSPAVGRLPEGHRPSPFHGAEDVIASGRASWRPTRRPWGRRRPGRSRRSPCRRPG